MPRPHVDPLQLRPDARSLYAMRRAPSRGESGGTKLIKDAEVPTVKETWQGDAYSFCEAIGEVGYCLNVKANVLSQCRLIAERRVAGTDQWEATDDARVMRALTALRTEQGEQGELLRQASMHLNIAGECYLYGENVIDERGRSEGVIWAFLSPLELIVKGPGRATRSRFGGSRGQIEVPANAYYARMHYQDPRYSGRADSSLRRVLPIMRELVLLTQVIDAVAKSKLPAGAFYLPDEFSFGPQDEYDDDGNPANGEDELEVEMGRHLTAPVEDATSPERLLPFNFRGPAVIDGMKAKDLFGLVDLTRPLDGILKDLRAETIERLAAGLDMPPEIMKGKGSSNHWCHATDTEVLTPRGWLGIDDFEVGDELLTLNHETGLTEWAPTTDVYVAEVEDLEMVSIRSNVHDSLTTGDHSWPVLRRWCGDCGERPPTSKGLCLRCWRRAKRATGAAPEAVDEVVQRLIVKSKDLLPTDRLILGAETSSTVTPDASKWSDSFVELMAWASTDGALIGGRTEGNTARRMLIRQSPTANPAKCLSIRVAIRDVLGNPVSELAKARVGDRCVEWRERFDDIMGVVEWHLSAGYVDELLASKVVRVAGSRLLVEPEWIRSLTKAQMLLFLDTVQKANGHQNGASSVLFAKDEDRLDAAELAAVLLGYRVSRVERPQTEQSFGTEPLTTLSWGPMTETSVGVTEIVSYTGRVWCPHVPTNHTYLARRNGKAFYTGNSAYNIDADFIAQHVIPEGDKIANFLTTSYLRPMLVVYEDMSKADVEWFRFRLDPSSIVANIDRSANATTGVGLNIVSDEAWARRNGLTEEDIADDDTKKRRELVVLLTALPALGQVILPYLYPDDPGIISMTEHWPAASPAPGAPDAAPGVKPAPGIPGAKAPAAGPPGMAVQFSDVSDQWFLALGANTARSFDAAMATAAARTVRHFEGIDRDFGAGLRGRPTAAVLSMAKTGPAEAPTDGDLLAGVWDQLAADAFDWLLMDATARGIPMAEARRCAAAAVEVLVAGLDRAAAAEIREPGAVPAGVDPGLIREALATGDLAQRD